MQRSPFKPFQRAQISLSALLLVSCLLLFSMGPFQAARAYLRGDSALAKARIFRHYREHATHFARQELNPGQQRFTFETIPLNSQWHIGKNDQISLHQIRISPEDPALWPEVTSLWIHTRSLTFEIRGESQP